MTYKAVLQIPTGGMNNVFLLRGKEGNVLVDTGPPGKADLILARLAEHGVAPRDVHLILITHGHTDHFGSAAVLRQRTGAPVAVHALDVEAIRRGTNPAETLKPTYWMVALMMRIPGVFGEGHAPPFEPDIVFEKGWRLEECRGAGEVIPTPGHTPGSVSVYLESGEAIVGDLVMSGFLQLSRRAGRPLFIWDVKHWRASLRRLVDLSPHIIHATHGGPFQVKDLARLIGAQLSGEKNR